ncbi:hypothetical protein BC628DRAFT_1387007 [Trametes gibbosa]|nr:hypothetical protein BC628DRAFT_1387007 [Trametes gibbosa]
MRESDVLALRTAHGQTIHTLASSVWLLYDLLTTFDQEVEFVWRSPNTLPKYLYLVSRYVGLLGQFALASGLMPVYCRGQLLTSLIFFPCLILSIELSLMLRIDALYGRSRKVRALLLTAFVAEIASAAVVNSLTYPTVFAELRPFPPDWPFKGCFFPVDIYLNKFCWFPVIAFETLLFCLNTAKCTSYGRLEHTPLIFRLFRDGSVYFAIAFAFMLVCIICQFLNVDSVSTALSTWISAVFSYSGCHLLLSVRSVAAKRERLDLTLLCAHASESHTDLASSSPLSLYLPDPPPPPPQSPAQSSPSRAHASPRISLPRRYRGASIELLPRLGLSRAGRSESADSQERTRTEDADGATTASALSSPTVGGPSDCGCAGWAGAGAGEA